MAMEKNQDSKVIMGRYKLGRLLGRGTFAKVYKAHNISTGEVVAIKVFDKEAVRRSGTVDQVRREVDVMRRLHHPNVVRLHEVMATRSRIYFVMEYASGGELFARLAESTRFPEPVARRYFQQLITAVEFCHSRGVYHRDLKPENLLLDAHGNLKVSDFGLSALADGASRHRGDALLHTTCGTPAYVAPEVILKRGYDGAKADIWSCGVILFVLLAGRLPFHDTNLVLLYKRIARSDYQCPAWFSIDARKLLARLLDPNPNTRITITKLMARTWFQKDSCPLSDKPLDTSETAVFLGQEAGGHHDDDQPEGATRKRKRSKVTASSPTINVRPSSMNAFDIISRSSVLDLAKMFDAEHKTSEARFSSKETTTVIVSKLGKIAEAGRFSFKLNKEKGRVELEGSQDGRKRALALEAEIFEVAPSVHVVEMRKTGGDSLEFQDFYKQELKPSLGDIVWAWQGGDSPPPTLTTAVPRSNTNS
ncbi:CBL-interacting protein kinase 30-like isoform X1 [Triticum urartu]|uniref:non-specific serine/threonine protein kinase n=1 Tax=Triticum urartu TaxID=4572 RepID=A0A8R7TYF9_TRIUA|nr:CBL-interacting protein kinase 30-like isoform X1 [Triticum urartu]